MKHIVCFISVVFIPFCLFSQNAAKTKTRDVAVIAFWNVENLYDTIDDRFRKDDEFTPLGTNLWTASRYTQKIDHLAEVIRKIGQEECAEGAAVIGLCEVENRSVLNDLVNSPALKERKYNVLHIEGPDPRGIDPALIYDPKRFRPQRTLAYNFRLSTDSTHRTRHILVVRGQLGGESVVFLINHWPSRRGGEKQSRPNRLAAARTAHRVCDSVMKASPSVKLFVMGDFNDDPTSQSLQLLTCTPEEKHPATKICLYNPMEKLLASGIGSLAFRDNWNLFDQILLSQNCLKGAGWSYSDARVFNPSFLRNAFGKYKGYPLRTFSGPVYVGGYSDHFPVYLRLTKDKSG